MNNVVSKDTVKRLLKDVKQIIQNPLNEHGIYYIHDDTDMLKGYALIIGQPDTPYFGGNYFFEFVYPNNYPHSPPIVKYCTNSNGIRFNPNLYACGKVCISILNTWKGEQWTSCQTITTILLSLCTVLCKDPLFNEPGVVSGKHDVDINSYNEIIEYSNISIAVCDVVIKNKNVYMPFFEKFEEIVKENFLKNVDKIIKFVENKGLTFNLKQQSYRTIFYNMRVSIDYNNILNKINFIKKTLTI